MEGVDGPARMAEFLDTLRNATPSQLGGVNVSTFGDYKAEVFVDMSSGEKTPTGMPKTNMLCFKLENGDIVIVRPSGTEPKVKIYFLVNAQSEEIADQRIGKYKISLNGK